MVSRLDGDHPLPHPLHNPRPLVAQDRGEYGGRLPFHEMVIASADAGGSRPHQHLSRLGAVQLHILHHEGGIVVVEHRGFHCVSLLCPLIL